MFEALALLSILVGLVLGATAWYWARYAQRLRWVHTQLQHIAPGQPLASQWTADLWHVLRAVGIQWLHWRGEWCGRPLEGTWGERPGAHERWRADIAAGVDVALTLHAGWRARGGEQDWLARAACELLQLHVQAAASADVARLDGALRQRSHHALQWMHDVRNLLQWLRWQCDDWSAQAADPGGCTRLCHDLADIAPMLRQRCERLMRAGDAQSHGPAPHPRAQTSADGTAALLDLAELVQRAARFHGVAVQVEGRVFSTQGAEVWLGILDELLHNTRRHTPTQTVRVRLEHNLGAATLTLELPLAAWGCDPTLLFVPFARGPDSAGWGLGLYLARRLARSHGGDLTAQDSPPALRLYLPGVSKNWTPDSESAAL